MGCVEASSYTSGTILGTYTGPNAAEECEQDCGLCCEFGCAEPTGFGSLNVFYDNEPYLTDATCSLSLLASNITSDCLAYGIGVGCTTQSNDISVFNFNTGFPSSGIDNYLIAYEANKGYTDLCNFYDFDSGSQICISEVYYAREIRYYECVSGILTDRTSEAISTINIYAYIEDGSSNVGLIAPGTFHSVNTTEDIVQTNSIIGTNVNYSGHYYSAAFVDSTGYYSIGSPPTIPCVEVPAPPTTSGQAPSTTVSPNNCPGWSGFADGVLGCNLFFPDNIETIYTCNDSITKSGCLSGGPNDTAIGLWFEGLNCSIAESGYGGCSGLANL